MIIKTFITFSSFLIGINLAFIYYFKLLLIKIKNNYYSCNRKDLETQRVTLVWTC